MRRHVVYQKGRRRADNRDEFAPFPSVTSSARASSVCGYSGIVHLLKYRPILWMEGDKLSRSTASSFVALRTGITIAKRCHARRFEFGATGGPPNRE
jgi:hypothetical protein